MGLKLRPYTSRAKYAGDPPLTERQSCYIIFIIRPSDILVGGLRFYRNSFFLSIFFRPLPSELAERNSTKTDHNMLGSKCLLKMHVRDLEILSQKSGPKTTFFDDFAT